MSASKPASIRLHDTLDAWAARQPQAEFALDGQRSLSYAQAQAMANRIAQALLAEGLRPGDRVATLMRNRIEFVLLCFGASKAGMIVVPFNCQLDPAQWTVLIEDARPSVLLAETEFIDRIDGIGHAATRIGRRIGVDGAAEATGWLAFDAWIMARDDHFPDVDACATEHLFQIYTSGTTGMPKGVLLSHAAVAANIAQIDAVMRWRPGERSLVALPQFHAALLPTTLAPLAQGGAVFILARFDSGAVIRTLNEERIATVTLVPTMIAACVAAADDIGLRAPHLRALYYGAAPISVGLLRQAMALFACDFIQSYGLTEASQAVTFLGPDDHARALRGEAGLLLSAGRAAPGTELRIADGEGGDGRPGAVGEIMIRGPQLMDGYWNQAQETEKVLADGWLRSGDVGSLDEDGYLYIRDRLKDIIISGGENVSSKTVEDVLRGHHAVADVAVIGIPDERWGEAVKGIVVVKQGSSCTAQDLIDHCRDSLSTAQRPRSIDFIGDLPRSATGKVRKDVLRRPYWENEPRLVR